VIEMFGKHFHWLPTLGWCNFTNTSHQHTHMQCKWSC